MRVERTSDYKTMLLFSSDPGQFWLLMAVLSRWCRMFVLVIVCPRCFDLASERSMGLYSWLIRSSWLFLDACILSSLSWHRDFNDHRRVDDGRIVSPFFCVSYAATMRSRRCIIGFISVRFPVARWTWLRVWSSTWVSAPAAYERKEKHQYAKF